MRDIGVIQSLEQIRDRVKEQLLSVKEYRAFLAVQKAIDEISEVREIVTSLETVRDQVQDRLNGVREYRALLAVEKSIADISEVLGILEEAAPAPAVPAPEAQPEIRAEVALAEVATAIGESAPISHWDHSGVTHEPAPSTATPQHATFEPAPDREREVAAAAFEQPEERKRPDQDVPTWQVA